MLKAIIIDDEENCCSLLKIRLEKHSKSIQIVGIANDIDGARQLIDEHAPDVIFLDIQLSNDSGFDLLEFYPDPDFEVVFVTAYNEYALKALKMSAIDYLLKPVDPEELEIAINKLNSKLIATKDNIKTNKIRVLQHNFDVTSNSLLRLVVPLMNGFEVININNIIYCKAESNYTKFFLDNKEEYLVCKTLKEFDELLSDLFFFRIHNSFLINIKHVKGYSKGKEGSVIMSNGNHLNISRQKKKEFLKQFLNG
jgi:two-component system LytT family response regulator